MHDRYNSLARSVYTTRD